MPRFKDKTNKRYGKLIALKKITGKNGLIYWNCVCDCGNKTTVIGSALGVNGTKSCGCSKKNNKNCLTHGMINTKLYKCWVGIKDRLSRSKYYKHLDLFPPWKKFEPFRDWALKNGWEDGLTIERKDNSKGYNPDNCIFIHKEKQFLNKRNVKLDWNKVNQIREMLKQGIKHKIIAAKFNVSRPLITVINLNKSWVI